MLTFYASITLADTPVWIDLTPCEVINNNETICMGAVDYAKSKEIENLINAVKNNQKIIITKPVIVVDNNSGYSILIRDRVPIGENSYCYVLENGSVYCG
ncbi:MAG: hypothetical protein ACTSWD_08060 [Candidatus Heimdallarchaeota archaeon]